MVIRQIPGRDCDTLKRACGPAVDKVGGVRRAAELLHLSASRVSEAASPFHDERWLSLLHAAELDACAGQPIIARALADLSGYDLVQREEFKPQDMHHHLARIVVECGDVSSQLSSALADGEGTDAERAGLSREIDQAVERLQALKSDLRPRLQQVKP